MSNDFNISRRKALAALGTIGVASAGAGLGTSAYFSDQETFENNQLTAGTLDMKVAATEYYSDWSSDEAQLGGMASDAASTDIRLPAGEEQSDAQDIAIDLIDDYSGDASDVYAAFFDTIATGDTVNGGLDTALDDGLCDDTPAADAEGRPIIDIADVKPGDFGGAQFAFELCDNPGYVWLNGGLVSASENGTTEPEADDPDEEDGVVELLDEIQVAYGVGPINGATSAFEDTDSGFQPVEQYTLREFLNAASSGQGLELAGDTPAEQGGGTGRNCFAGSPDEGSEVHQVSLVWWLPINHGNQVQSDSVTFDLGFYTEQCRHNDGAGMAPEPTTLSVDSPQGQGDGFAYPWDVSETLAHVGDGSWGTVPRDVGSYKQGFYFAGDFDSIDELPSTYTVADIGEISYWLYESSALDPSDIYLNIYTRPEGDGDDTVSWYDSRLQALPSDANDGSPSFTPGEWNEFSTASGASNTLAWTDGGRSGLDFTLPLPTLDDVQTGPIDWSTYGPSLSTTHDYRDEEVLALSLQVASNNTDLEAYIDDVTVTLTSGETLRLDLEP